MYMKFFNTAGLKKNKRWPFTPSVVTPSCTAARTKDSRTRVATHAGNQLYRECYIIGIVDFIFGYAAAIFQSCNILTRKSLPNKINNVQRMLPRNSVSSLASIDEEKVPSISFEMQEGAPYNVFSCILVFAPPIYEANRDQLNTAIMANKDFEDVKKDSNPYTKNSKIVKETKINRDCMGNLFKGSTSPQMFQSNCRLSLRRRTEKTEKNSEIYRNFQTK
ncbi:hypothetical protein YC2023_005927 [Brassica napus]